MAKQSINNLFSIQIRSLLSPNCVAVDIYVYIILLRFFNVEMEVSIIKK